MRELGVDGYKFAVTVRDEAELEALLAFSKELSAEGKPACAISMGAMGMVSRVLSPLLGSRLTYAFLGSSGVAPGQIDARQMHDIFQRLASLNLQGMDMPSLMQTAFRHLQVQR